MSSSQLAQWRNKNKMTVQQPPPPPQQQQNKTQYKKKKKKKKQIIKKLKLSILHDPRWVTVSHCPLIDFFLT